MLHIMNSAMMPTAGLTYKLEAISQIEARSIFQENVNNWKSYLGYPNTCKIASKILGKEIPMSRGKTVVKAGDTMLILKLRYRVNPDEKGKATHGNQAKDYDWYVCHVTKEEKK